MAKKTTKKSTKKKTSKKKTTKKKASKKGPKAGAKKAPSKGKVSRLSKKEMHDTFFQWKLDGYKVDDLEELIEQPGGARVFLDYRGKIEILKAIEQDVAGIQAKGFEQEVNVIKSRLKDPLFAETVQKAYKDLKHRMKEKMFISMVHEGFKVVKVEEPPKEKAKEAKKDEKKTEKKAEKKAEPEKAPDLEPGSCYLMEEEKPQRSYELYETMVASGKKGVCVTREFPDKLRKRYKLADTTIFWLSNTEAKNSFKPVELGKLYYNLEEFVKKNKNTVIMLSGLEYLITQNNYSSVLKLIQLLNEQIAINESILIVPISPSTLEEKDLKLIERELTVLR